MTQDMKGHLSERFTTDVAEVLRRRAESLAQESIEDSATGLIGLLLFRLAEEWYSVRVGNVREIFQEYKITPIPCVPDYILGVVNIRGEIISVTDLAKLTGIGQLTVDPEKATAIVIQNEDAITAIAVDEIGEIVDVPSDNIEPPVSTIGKAQAEFVAGTVYLDHRLVGLVNVDRILEPIGTAN